MSSSYELWLTDDTGRRLFLLDQVAFFSYSRSTQGYGTCLVGLPLTFFDSKTNLYFRPDWRIDFWRSPENGYPLRREGSFLLRKHRIYQREDGVIIVEYYGRSPIDLLRRDSNRLSTQFVITDAIDNIMKTLASYLSTSAGPFYDPVTVTPYADYTVDPNKSDGPSITYDATRKNILDAIGELKDISFQKNIENSANLKIYFDVIESNATPEAFGYKFVTFAGIRGADRSNGIVFSLQNGNIKEPSYIEDDLDEANYLFSTYSDGSTDVLETADSGLSRWNRITYLQTSSAATTSGTAAGIIETYRFAKEKARKVTFSCAFLNSPGSDVQPRSLYGVDWDFGDLLQAQFAGKTFPVEVAIVYVAMDEKGKESVLGRTEVGSA